MSFRKYCRRCRRTFDRLLLLTLYYGEYSDSLLGVSGALFRVLEDYRGSLDFQGDFGDI